MATSVTRLFDIIPYQLENYPKTDALSNKVKGSWVNYSTQEIINNVNLLSLGFLKLGIKKDDKVAIISQGRPEWNFVDLATQQIGAISVPIYPTITEADYKYIFKEADVKLIFVSDRALYDKVKNAIPEGVSVLGIYSFEETEGVKHWSHVKKMGEGENLQVLEDFKKAVSPEDIVTLIYTSGTTGNPKGVMLTHNNVLSNVNGCIPLMPVDYHARAISFLPICHVYERTQVFLYLKTGVSVYYAESLDTIGENLKEIHPHIFTTVPRLLEKVYDKIVDKGSQLTGVKRALFYWALNLGLKFKPEGDNGLWYDMQLWLANKLIFNKWREALGGNIKVIISGSAALQDRLARVFCSANILVVQGYGLTETSPVISVNPCILNQNKIGTVGPPLSNVQIKFAEDGEILTKGPCVMKGYYKNEEMTRQVIDKEGWFHTGDIGTLVDGYIKITDRKKEMFKTSGGKYVAPQVIENKFKESRFVEQVMVVGEGQKFPGALIVPNFSSLKSWCGIKGISYTSDEGMIKNPAVLEKFTREVESLNINFAQYEKIKKFCLLPKVWTVEDGLLSPNMKVKRKFVAGKYQNEIENLFKE
jgi:long-chain acyl-CoA synthetase